DRDAGVPRHATEVLGGDDGGLQAPLRRVAPALPIAEPVAPELLVAPARRHPTIVEAEARLRPARGGRVRAEGALVAVDGGDELRGHAGDLARLAVQLRVPRHLGLERLSEAALPG